MRDMLLNIEVAAKVTHRHKYAFELLGKMKARMKRDVDSERFEKVERLYKHFNAYVWSDQYVIFNNNERDVFVVLAGILHMPYSVSRSRNSKGDIGFLTKLLNYGCRNTVIGIWDKYIYIENTDGSCLPIVKISKTMNADIEAVYTYLKQNELFEL